MSKTSNTRLNDREVKVDYLNNNKELNKKSSKIRNQVLLMRILKRSEKLKN